MSSLKDRALVLQPSRKIPYGPVQMPSYYRTPEREWIGKPVRLLREVQTNGGTFYPAGTRAVVVRKRKGFELRSEACRCCGVMVTMKNVDPLAVEVLRPGE